MRIKPGRQWLLILALLVGQWLLVAHTHSHPALALDQACQICVHATGIDTGALAGKPAALVLSSDTEAPSNIVRLLIPAAAENLPRIRGPPALLA